VVEYMWAPQALAALVAPLPLRLEIKADAVVYSQRSVEALLQLHASRRLSLEALTLRRADSYGAEAFTALVAALSPTGRLGSALWHVVIDQCEHEHAMNWPYKPLLAALADGGAPALHTLELRNARPEGMRSVAALLQGGEAFLLKRLTMLMRRADAGSLNALADALPPTLHTLVLDVRISHDRDTPVLVAALRALLYAAAQRCPGLRSVQLGTGHDHDDLVAACRKMMYKFAVTHSNIDSSYRAYTQIRERFQGSMCARKVVPNPHPGWP
jgi:hypothetical protein